MKDGLKLDVDVGLAIDAKMQHISWIKVEILKVWSHIAVEEAPNEFYWMVNDTADRLATEAKKKVEEQEEVAKIPVPSPRNKSNM